MFRYDRYARRLQYKSLSDDRFEVLLPPDECTDWVVCVYRTLRDLSESAVKPLSDRFKAHAKEYGLNKRQLAELTVAFVQNIPYTLQPDQNFGIRPPALVAADYQGDCDSKTMLGRILLMQMDIDTLVIYTRAHTHVLLAIGGFPVTGDTFTYRGREFAFVEMTHPGWPVGKLPPTFRQPGDLSVVPVVDPTSKRTIRLKWDQ